MASTNWRSENDPLECQQEPRDKYTAAVKTRDGFRGCWKGIKLVGAVFLLGLGSKTETVPLCVTLLHQMRSLDDTCDKLAQSFPRAICIFNAVWEHGGLGHNLSAACARVGQIKSLPLTETRGLALGGIILGRAPWSRTVV